MRTVVRNRSRRQLAMRWSGLLPSLLPGLLPGLLVNLLLSLLLNLLLSLAAPLAAQPLELATRFDYYLAKDSSATLLLVGERWADAERLFVDGHPATADSPYQDAARFRIDISAYSIGRHDLASRVVLTDGTDEELTLRLRKLPDKPNAVRVDRLTGGLIVDDLPFFPFGFYAGFPVGDLPIQEVYNAMNMIGVYQDNEEETLAGRKAYMDLCAALGMKVNYAVNGLVGTPHNRTDAVISQAEEDRRWALLRREIETFKDHPALLSWYLNDEPVGQSRPPELLEEAYRIIKEIDPYHPVSVVFVIPERAAPFVDALDIAMTDPYPIPGDVDAVRAHMRALADNFRFRKALWLVPQAFGGGEFWRREPTGPEIRTMTWLGIQEGAMGIQYFIRRHPNLFPKSRLAWNEAVRAAHEASMILPWLFSDEPRHRLPTGSERIQALALPSTGSALILVTNTDNRQASFEIDISSLGPPDSTSLRLPFENRSVAVVGGKLAETIGPLDTRAYLLDAGVGDAAELDRYNLFPNPSFEWVTSPGVPAGAYADSDHRPAYDGSTYFIDSRVSHKGRNSLRLHAVSDTSHLRLSFYQMYVQKGRPYHASLWSRRPVDAPPVPFRISIRGLELEKEFTASQGWKRHDFQFKATEIPSVQLVLETAGAGTVWVDEVVIVPDPRVEVVVRDGPMAEVRVHSQDSGASVRYSLNGADTRRYTTPFEVHGFTDVGLYVRRPDAPEDTIAVTVPLSLATLKNCSFSTPYSKKYTGSGDGTIVDGEYGSLSFRDDRYLGFDGKDVEFTMDLEAQESVRSATVHFLVSPDDGIHAPVAVEGWTSADGNTWASLGRVEELDVTRHGNPYHLSVPVQGSVREARLVRVRVTSPKVIPDGYLFGGTDAWLFIDEALVE